MTTLHTPQAACTKTSGNTLVHPKRIGAARGPQPFDSRFRWLYFTLSFGPAGETHACHKLACDPSQMWAWATAVMQSYHVPVLGSMMQYYHPTIQKALVKLR